MGTTHFTRRQGHAPVAGDGLRLRSCLVWCQCGGKLERAGCGAGLACVESLRTRAHRHHTLCHPLQMRAHYKRCVAFVPSSPVSHGKRDVKGLSKGRRPGEVIACARCVLSCRCLCAHGRGRGRGRTPSRVCAHGRVRAWGWVGVSLFGCVQPPICLSAPMVQVGARPTRLQTAVLKLRLQALLLAAAPGFLRRRGSWRGRSRRERTPTRRGR